MNAKERQENYELLYNTIKTLSKSQGFYGRCLQNLNKLTEYQKQKLIKQLPKFSDTVDTVLWLEQ